MPHLVIHYTANLDAEANMRRLCRALADIMLRAARRRGQAGLPDRRHARAGLSGRGTRRGRRRARDRAFVLPEPAHRRAAARRGTSAADRRGIAGDGRRHFAALFARRHSALTLQIDEGATSFDAKHSNLHPLFAGK